MSLHEKLNELIEDEQFFIDNSRGWNTRIDNWRNETKLKLKKLKHKDEIAKEYIDWLKKEGYISGVWRSKELRKNKEVRWQEKNWNEINKH